MNVLIVARTTLNDLVCIGAVENNGSSRRLMTATGQNQPTDCGYRVGDVWEVRASAAAKLTPPHVEDVIVEPVTREGTCDDLAGRLRTMREQGLVTNWWRGPISSLFEGRTRSTMTSFSRFVDPGRLPTCSVGFWEPHADLVLEPDETRPIYRFETPGEFARMPYKGQVPPVPVISKGTLVRVSLSRLWAPPKGPQGFWTQLSGWYPNHT